MNTWIALLRGINVGGKNKVKMAALRDALESIGLKNVRTYIQSGNIVFESRTTSSSRLSAKIVACIDEEFGFRPCVFVLGSEALRLTIERNPFPDAVSDSKTLHLGFLASPAKDADLESIANAKAASESYLLDDGVFYLLAPGGIARSKLAAGLERWLGVAMTSRNYRTVMKLAAMTKHPLD